MNVPADLQRRFVRRDHAQVGETAECRAIVRSVMLFWHSVLCDTPLQCIVITHHILVVRDFARQDRLTSTSFPIVSSGHGRRVPRSRSSAVHRVPRFESNVVHVTSIRAVLRQLLYTRRNVLSTRCSSRSTRHGVAHGAPRTAPLARRYTVSMASPAAQRSRGISIRCPLG